MPPKSKVETSPHFEEIVNLLLQGESGRKVSAYLKNKYNEDIGFNAINSYRRKHIKLEEKVIREVDKRLAEKTEKVAIEKVDQAERIEKSSQHIVNSTADQLQGLLKVGADFEKNYKAMKHSVYDPESKVTQKDITEMSLKANKLYLDFIKSQDTNVEVNIENNTDLSKAFNEDKMRKILDAKRGGNK